MSNTLSLDDLRTAVETKYASLNVEVGDGKTAVLVNALQLPVDERAKLVSIQDKLDGGDDQVTVLQDALRVAGSGTPSETEKLIELVDGNLAYLIELFSRYSKGTQVGEA